MAKPKVYVETTVVSYLTARPTRDVVITAHQQLTREWWEKAGQRFELIVSEIVLKEAAGGDAEAAAERLAHIASLPLVRTTDIVTRLSTSLVQDGAMPVKASADALHLAIATVHGMDYLVTWNCRHLANASIRTPI